MGSYQDAVNAVREAAFRSMSWTDQATGVVAVNGEPTSATDGVSLQGRSAFAVQVEEEVASLVCDVVVWGYADGAWGKIPGGAFSVDPSLLEATQNAGACERVYIEVSAYTSGTATLKVGVPLA